MTAKILAFSENRYFNYFVFIAKILLGLSSELKNMSKCECRSFYLVQSLKKISKLVGMESVSEWLGEH